MGNVKQLLEKINVITRHHKELIRLSGENFNLFKILGLVSDEVKVHSAFIAELLNPKGSHGQDDIFLKLFLNHFCIKEFDTASAKIEVEKSIGMKTDTTGGRLDIYVSDQKGHDFIIENKIYAGDQQNQLIRYANFSNQKIFYLTLDGHEPNILSCGNLSSEEDFFCISYQEDILKWLELCRKEASTLPLLREGISHYINLIKYLTNQSNSKVMNEEILNVLIESPDTLRDAHEIVNVYKKAKQKIQWTFWKSLRESLENKGLIICENNWTVTAEFVWKYYNEKRNNQYYGLCVEIFKTNDIAIYWGCQIEHNIYTGFIVEKNEKQGIARKEEFDSYCEVIKLCDENYVRSEYWLGWQYTNPMLNFRLFNSDAIFQLVDEDYLREIVSLIVDKAVHDIEFVKPRLM